MFTATFIVKLTRYTTYPCKIHIFINYITIVWYTNWTIYVSTTLTFINRTIINRVTIFESIPKSFYSCNNIHIIQNPLYKTSFNPHYLSCPPSYFNPLSLLIIRGCRGYCRLFQDYHIEASPLKACSQDGVRGLIEDTMRLFPCAILPLPYIRFRTS